VKRSAILIGVCVATVVLTSAVASADTVSGQGTTAGTVSHGGNPANGSIYYASSVQVNRDPVGEVTKVRGAARITKVSKATAVQVDRIAISRGTVLAAANNSPINSHGASSVISYTAWLAVAPSTCVTYRVRANYSVRWGDGSVSHLTYLSPLTSVCGPTVPPVYANCQALNQKFPHGVGRPGAVDHTTGPRVTNYYVSAYIYNANPARDADNDGIACEKH
jgi:hypothetical protein